MCMGSLTLIFTRSFKTLQPTRPFGLVTSKFDWQSLKTSVKEPIQNRLNFYATFTKHWKKLLEPLKTASEILSSTIALTAHFYGTLVLVRVTGPIRSDCLFGGHGRGFQHSKSHGTQHPKTFELTNKFERVRITSMGNGSTKYSCQHKS